MAFLAEAEEAAERHHCVRDLAGLLVDHQAIDRAELFAFDVEDSRAFNLA